MPFTSGFDMEIKCSCNLQDIYNKFKVAQERGKKRENNGKKREKGLV